MKMQADELKKLEMFNNISSQTIERILDKSDIKDYKAGEILFQDKENVSTVYFIIKGTLL